MKNYFLIFLVPFFFSCTDESTNPDIQSVESGSMLMKINMTTAPLEVVSISGYLTRTGYDTIFIDFVVDEQFAQAYVQNIPLGSWTLTVNAMNSENIIIFSGKTTILIMPGENSVDLILNPTTGNLEINVTWGNGYALEVLTQFDTHYTYVTGIAYDGKNLLIASGYGGDGGTQTLYKIDVYGQEISSYRLGFVPSQPYWGDNILWIQEEHTHLDYAVKMKYDSNTDSFIKELRIIPSVERTDIEAMTYENGYIWLTQEQGSSPRLCKLSANDGSILSQFEGNQYNKIDGLAYDGAYLWAINDYGKLMKIDTHNGNIILTYEIAPVSEAISNGEYSQLYENDAGLAFDNSDAGLWIVWQTGRVMKVLLP